MNIEQLHKLADLEDKMNRAKAVLECLSEEIDGYNKEIKELADALIEAKRAQELNNRAGL